MTTRADHLRAPWPSALGAGTSLSSAVAIGARRGTLEFITRHSTCGPPVVLEGGTVVCGGDGYLELLDPTGGENFVRLGGVSRYELCVLPDGRLLSSGKFSKYKVTCLSLEPLLSRELELGDSVYVGPRGGIAADASGNGWLRGPDLEVLDRWQTRRAKPHSSSRPAFAGEQTEDLWALVVDGTETQYEVEGFDGTECAPRPRPASTPVARSFAGP